MKGRLRVKPNIGGQTRLVLTIGFASLAMVIALSAAPKDHVHPQGLTHQQRADLCKEKKQGLQNYEKRSLELRSERVHWNQRKNYLLGLTRNATRELDEQLETTVNRIETLKRRIEDKPGDDSLRAELDGLRSHLDLLAQLRSVASFRPLSNNDVTSNPLYREAESRLRAIEQEQLTVANQISILRGAVESLGCDQINEPKPGKVNATTQLMKE